MTSKRAILHCNAGGTYGIGHLMRCLALAEEASSRGWQVRVVGDIDAAAIDHATRVHPALDIERVRSDQVGSALRGAAGSGVDVIHLDSYWDVPDLAGFGPAISNMQDGTYGVRPCDLAVDANLDSEVWFERADLSRVQLAGIDAAVIRRQVLRQRGAPTEPHRRFRVLVVMGGTDPGGLSPKVARALSTLPGSLDVTVVAPEPAHQSIRAGFREGSHTLTLRTFVDDLPALAHRQDLVVSAAGTSVWDFACMGVPVALVCAVDNQRRGYRAIVEAGLAIPLGEPPHADLETRLAEVSSLIEDGSALSDTRNRLRRAVDGRGTWRIISAWEALVLGEDVGSTRAATVALQARAARIGDAKTLFDWRNDETTRIHSRSHEALSWDAHVSWLERCLADPRRRLFIVTDASDEVGTVRWDRGENRDWEVSITVAPAHRGRRLGAAVLAAGEKALAVEAPVRMLAGIHGDNSASGRLFRGAGYLPHLPADAAGFSTFAKWRFAGPPSAG